VTPHQWQLRSYLELGALPTEVPCARLHARHLLWEWGLNGLAADTELLVSELVTNAVKATAGQQRAAIRLQLSSDSASVLVEVWDADPRPPAPKDLTEGGTPDLQEEGGRGLFLVAALSTRWDWYLTQEPPGKVVWCELSADLIEPDTGAQSPPQALLPRRTPHTQHEQPAEVMNDPEILSRVRDRLRDPDRSNLPVWPNLPTIWT
jgi:anti-sigma regulatory factor (Ser/Thr protein kinase)